MFFGCKVTHISNDNSADHAPAFDLITELLSRKCEKDCAPTQHGCLRFSAQSAVDLVLSTRGGTRFTAFINVWFYLGVLG